MTTRGVYGSSTGMERMDCAALVTIGSLWRRRFVHLRLTCRTLFYILLLSKNNSFQVDMLWVQVFICIVVPKFIPMQKRKGVADWRRADRCSILETDRQECGT